MKTKDPQSNLGGGLRLFPDVPPKVDPKIVNRSASLESTLRFDDER